MLGHLQRRLQYKRLKTEERVETRAQWPNAFCTAPVFRRGIDLRVPRRLVHAVTANLVSAYLCMETERIP